MLRSRPDACPGAWRRHDAADGALARFRPVGGAIVADELRLLAGAAAVGGSPLELTSRGSLQVRGLAGSIADDLADALRADRPEALLDTRGRDVPCGLLASPRSTRLDPVAVAAALRGRTDVPGRLLVALEDRGGPVGDVTTPTTGDVSGQGADITVVLTSSGRSWGSSGGAAPHEGPLGEDPEAALLLDGPLGVVDTGLRHPDPAALALAAVDAFTARRDAAWRVRELDEATRDALIADVRDRTTADVVTPVLTPGPADPTALGPRDDGTLEVLPRLGELDLGVVAALVGLLGVPGQGATLRATPWRTLVLRGLADPEAAARRLDGLVETDPASRWRGVSACVGAPRCAKSHADVRGDLAAAVASGHVGGTVRQHWVGCARACGTPGGRVAVIEALDPAQPRGEQRGTYRTVVRSGRVTG
jgi:precorrin-3B synthase